MQAKHIAHRAGRHAERVKLVEERVSHNAL